MNKKSNQKFTFTKVVSADEKREFLLKKNEAYPSRFQKSNMNKIVQNKNNIFIAVSQDDNVICCMLVSDYDRRNDKADRFKPFRYCELLHVANKSAKECGLIILRALDYVIKEYDVKGIKIKAATAHSLATAIPEHNFTEVIYGRDDYATLTHRSVINNYHLAMSSFLKKAA